MTEPTDNPPPHVLGQLDLSDRELSPAELAAADEAFSAELDRIRQARVNYTTRALELVRAAAAADALTGSELDKAVANARAAGATWQQIGDAVGMARQSAWKRWASPTDHDHGRHVIGGRCSVCNAEVSAP